MSDAFGNGSNRPGSLGGENSADMAGILTALTASNQLMGRLISALEFQFPAETPYESYLNIAYSSAGGTTVALGPGGPGGGIAYLCSIFVTDASTGTEGAIYDAASPTDVSSTNRMALIPSSGSQVYNIPFVDGLTIQPSSQGSHTVSVYFINHIPEGA